MKSLRSVLGWGALAVFSSVNLLQAINLTCPGATDLVLKNGKCQLVELKYKCVANPNAFDIRTCVPGATTAAQMSFCTVENEPCFVAEKVEHNPNKQCSTDGASGTVLAQSVPCP